MYRANVDKTADKGGHPQQGQIVAYCFKFERVTRTNTV